jgi:hypothetical protein
VNLGQFRSALDRLTGVGMDATAQTEWVNAAVQAIGSDRAWPWLDEVATVTTVAGTAGYALPADWQSTRGVASNGRTYYPVSVRSGDGSWDDWRDTLSFGFAVEDGQLVLYPTPAESGVAVTHRYVRTEPVLSSDSDTPLLPSRFHWAVVHYAAALIFDRMGQMPQAAAQRAEYDKWRRSMLDDLTRTRGPHRIRVRPGSGL